MDQPVNTAALLEELTDKQREVLDLLVLHKTSKQIARELGISPHTVDQRIAAARRKFAVETRNELAAAYMAAQAGNGEAPVYERPVYQSPHVDIGDDPVDKDVRSAAEAGDGETPDKALAPQATKDSVTYYRVVPESFEGRYGLFWRLAAIVGMTLGLLIAVLVGFAIYGQLSELLR